MKKQLFAALLCGCLLPMTGCGSTEPLTAEEAEEMLETVYHIDFTYIDSQEAEENGRCYTFHDPVGGETQFIASVENVDGKLQPVGRSNFTEQHLAAYASQWNALCDEAGITYVQDGAVWKLTLAHTDELDQQVMEISETAELIQAMLDSAPIQESQTEGYVSSDYIEVYYQTETDAADSGTYICGYNLAGNGFYTIEYLAGDIQLWMRQEGLLAVES